MTNTYFELDEQSQENAKIKVIGVGGGGGNAINNMIEAGLTNVQYIALNTDSQALNNNKAQLKIQVGNSLTSGLGAGARPEVGREAIEENQHQITEILEDTDMVFITAGMGGGTGTGGAPVVAGIAKRKGILTVGIVTTPFECEGRKRQKYANEGIDELRKNCDTIIVIPNEKLLDMTGDDTSLVKAFQMANEVLLNATKGISDLILMPGLINLDFADVKTTMTDGGTAIMGAGVAEGEDRAEIAAREAINSPFLEGINIKGARNVLVNISASRDLGLRETNTAVSIIQEEAGDEAEIILGTVLDDSYGDSLRVTVIATGFESFNTTKENKPTPTQKNQYAIPAIDVPEIKVRINKESNEIEYKGKENLERLAGTPAFLRKEKKINLEKSNDSFEGKSVQYVAEDEEERASNVNPINARTNDYESDSKFPAFLRKIMD